MAGATKRVNVKPNASIPVSKQVTLFEDTDRKDYSRRKRDTGIDELEVLSGGHEQTTAVLSCSYLLIHPDGYVVRLI